MPAAVPIGNGDCGECNTCCVLNVVSKSPCHKLFWDCSCPGGVLTMQIETVPGLGFADIADWTADGPNYWYPWDPFLEISVVSTRKYRLKCTLGSGEVFYSNEVTVALNSTACQCYDSSTGLVKSVEVEIDYGITSFTATGPDPADITWGTETPYTAQLNCDTGRTPQILFDRTIAVDGGTRQWVEATFYYDGTYLTLLIVGKYQLVSPPNPPGQPIFTVPGMGAFARVAMSSLVKGSKCYSQCYAFTTNNAPNGGAVFCDGSPTPYCAAGILYKTNGLTLVYV